MDERWARYATDAFVLGKRIDILQHKLPAWLRTVAAAPYVHEHWDGERHVETPTRARMRSVALAVSQHWADNANDEVHFQFAYSTRAAPLWPHDCPTFGAETVDLALCGDCDNFDHVDWGYGDLIPAFEPWCHELATQEEPMFDAYRPIAVARFDGDRIAVELVGALVRPWLDLPQDAAARLPLDEAIHALVQTYTEDPRAIVALADALQQRGDPRGELIALAQHLAPSDVALSPLLAFGDVDGDLRSRHGELLGICGRAWLGSFDRHVPRSAIAYRRGLPAELGLWIERGADVDRDDPLPWALAPRVRFLPTSAVPIVPGLASAWSLGPLDDVALEDIAALGIPFAAREVEVEPLSAEDPPGLSHLAKAMPHLRRLCLAGEAAGTCLLGEHVHFAGLEHVEVASPTDAVDLPNEIRNIAKARLPFPVACTMYDRVARRAAGWSATILDGRATISHRGYLREADEAYLAALHQALAQCDLRIERAASATWSPEAV